MKKILYSLMVMALSIAIVGCGNRASSKQEESPYAGFEYDQESDEGLCYQDSIHRYGE